jgi:16S rRNA (guanine527-N7)-methyltransferase
VADDERLLEILAEAARLGLVGGTSLGDHVAHARRFAAALGGADTVLDLGSGGGLPGLVLAWDGAATRVVLLDANTRRTDFLRRAVGRLALADRVTVWTGRAEILGRDAERRLTQDAVVARSFGPPARTAECAAPFLRVGGRLVVSEPPEPGERWPADRLAPLGLRPVPSDVVGLRVFEQFAPCPARFPRRRLEPPVF